MLKPIYKMTREINHVKTGIVAKRYRERREVTGQQVADHMGIKQSIVSKLESGKRRWTQDEFDKYVAAVDTINAGDIPPN